MDKSHARRKRMQETQKRNIKKEINEREMNGEEEEDDTDDKENNDETDDEEEDDEEEGEEIANAMSPNLFDDTCTKNSWKTWGNELNRQAKASCKIEGDRANAHYMPKLADRLLKDIRWLPLWSCILRDRYGYGRVPASSAPSESDFNCVKTHLLKRRKPIRIDAFVNLQIDNIEGRMIIADAKTVDDSTNNTVGSNVVEEESKSDDPDELISRPIVAETCIEDERTSLLPSPPTNVSLPESDD